MSNFEIGCSLLLTGMAMGAIVGAVYMMVFLL